MEERKNNGEILDRQIVGVREYLEMSNQIARLEKFEEQVGSKMAQRDAAVDKKLEGLEHKIDELHKETVKLVTEKVADVKFDVEKMGILVKDNHEKTREEIKSVHETLIEYGASIKTATKLISIGGFGISLLIGLLVNWDKISRIFH